MKGPKGKSPSDSKRANLKWIGVVLVLLLAAYVTASEFVVYSLYAVLFTMLLSRLLMEINVRGLVCEREVSKAEAVIGETIEVALTIRNRSNFPMPWAFVEELLPEKMPASGDRATLVTLGPHREKKMQYQMTVNRRGYHQIGPALIETGDLFGFFKRYRTIAADDFVTVFPTVEPIMEFDITTRRPVGPARITNRIYEDPSRIIAVREYVAGDPLNRIHWKTTARTGALHSKVFEPSVAIGSTFVLDLHQDGYRGAQGRDRMELAISAAASLANYVANANEQVGLFSNGRDLAEAMPQESSLPGRLREKVVARAQKRERSKRMAPLIIPTRRSAEQGRLILETLARIDSTDGLTLDKMLAASLQRLGRDSATLVIVPEVTDDLAVTLSIIKEAGYLVTVFIIENESGYFNALEKLSSKFIDVYHIRGIEDIAKFATQDIYY